MSGGGRDILLTDWLMEQLGCRQADPWNQGRPFSAPEVLAASEVHDQYVWPAVHSRAWHAGRIKSLARGPISPVPVDVFPDGRVEMVDGHHRLHAADLLLGGLVAVELIGYVDELPAEARGLTAGLSCPST